MPKQAVRRLYPSVLTDIEDALLSLPEEQRTQARQRMIDQALNNSTCYYEV